MVVVFSVWDLFLLIIRRSRTGPYLWLTKLILYVYRINAIPVMTTSSDTASSQVITEYGKQNIFGRETQPQLVEDYTSYPEEAEKTNGRWAMIGMVSLLVSYFTTGQIIPGIFWALIHPLILAITSTLLKSSNLKKLKKQMVVGQWSALLLF